jgi:hypothetical protein
MWISLLLMAAAVSLEPFRIGMTVLMLNRPRPLLQLLAFLGGFAMGTTVGLIVLFLVRPAAGSAHFTLPRVQLVVGALLLVLGAAVASGKIGPRPDRAPGVLAARARQLLEGQSLWVAGVAGLGIALPSVDYLAALALIVVSGAAATTQVGALLMFNVVAFGLVEIPLLWYLVAPERTRAALSALYEWMQSDRRRKVATLFATVGCVLVAVGLVGL